MLRGFSLFAHLQQFFAYSRDASSVLVVSMDLMKNRKSLCCFSFVDGAIYLFAVRLLSKRIWKRKGPIHELICIKKWVANLHHPYHPPHLECNPELVSIFICKKKRFKRIFKHLLIALPPLRDWISSVLNEIQQMFSLFILFISFHSLLCYMLAVCKYCYNSIWYEFDWANWWIRNWKFTYVRVQRIPALFHTFSSFLFFYFDSLKWLRNSFLHSGMFIQWQCNQQLPLWTYHSHFHINSENIQSLRTSSFRNLMNNGGKRFAFFSTFQSMNWKRNGKKI